MSYKYELHCHCKEISPCGWLSAEETARLYRQAGYDGLVMTDHFRTDIIETLPGKNWEEKMASYWKPQTVDKVLRETYVSRSLFLSIYEICVEKRNFPLGLCHP